MVLSKKAIGLLIKDARKHKSEIIGRKYTQETLAEDLGLSRGYIGDVESGRIYPNYVLLNRIAEKCEVPLGFFENEKNNYTHEIYGNHELHEEVIKSSVANVNTADYDEINEVGYAMEVTLDQPGLMLNGELLSDASKMAIANAIQMGLAYAAKIQEKEKK